VIQLQCLYSVVTKCDEDLELYPIIEEFDETEMEVEENVEVTIYLLRFSQIVLIILILCLWYTAIVIDEAQRIGIIIFATASMLLLYIFNYYRTLQK